jgi:hypothetical protein
MCVVMALLVSTHAQVGGPAGDHLPCTTAAASNTSSCDIHERHSIIKHQFGVCYGASDTSSLLILPPNMLCLAELHLVQPCQLSLASQLQSAALDFYGLTAWSDSLCSLQPACRVYKAFRTTASSGTLLDTIRVVDDFPVASVQVSCVSLFHPDAQNLQLSLAHMPGPDAELAPSALTAAEGGSTGGAVGPVYVPESSMGGTSAGQWVLRITDNTTGTGRYVAYAMQYPGLAATLSWQTA